MKKCYKTLRKQAKIFSKSFMGKNKMTEKRLNYFILLMCLGMIYSLPKIHKIIFHVSGRPVILHCSKLTEKVLRFSDRHLKGIIQESSRRKWSNLGQLMKNFKSLL